MANKPITIDIPEPNPKQLLFLQSKTYYTCYGGAKAGGKTWAVQTKAILGATHYPGIRILILRRRYPELQQNHIEPMIRRVPQGLAQYNGSLRVMTFVNGSTIKFGHYQGDVAELEYQGQEYDWIFMDEATQFTERAFRYLGGCLRGVNEIPKRFYLTCNPGGVGHKWVKRLFIDRKFKTGSANPEENENPDDYLFIFATVEDNTALLKANPHYLDSLSNMTENVRKAYRYGDWDSLVGGYFPEFSEATHVIKPFPIPSEWTRYRAFDYGLDMFACYWIAVDFNGRSYVYREFKQKELIVSDAANAIHQNTGVNEHISITYAPTDMWSRSSDTGKTKAEVFMTSGVGLVPASRDRVQGWLQVKEMLAPMKDGKPGLLFFDTCKEIISDLQTIQTDEKNPNDCAAEPDHDITHGPDSIRYYCISRTLAPKEDPPPVYREDDDIEDYDDYMTGRAIDRSYISYNR